MDIRDEGKQTRPDRHGAIPLSTNYCFDSVQIRESILGLPDDIGLSRSDSGLLPARVVQYNMLFIRGTVEDTTLTGTIYEEGETPPVFKGAPDEQAPYVWVCDEFYEVESGGQVQAIEGREVNVAFDSPMPRGFETREQAIEAASEHVRTQFARIGVDPQTVEIEVIDEAEADQANRSPHRSRS